MTNCHTECDSNEINLNMELTPKKLAAIDTKVICRDTESLVLKVYEDKKENHKDQLFLLSVKEHNSDIHLSNYIVSKKKEVNNIKVI